MTRGPPWNPRGPVAHLRTVVSGWHKLSVFETFWPTHEDNALSSRHERICIVKICIRMDMCICCLTLCVREPVTHGRPVCRSYYVTLPSPLATVSPYPHHCHITLANRPTSLLTLRCTQLASYMGKYASKYTEHKLVPLQSYKTTSPAKDTSYPT